MEKIVSKFLLIIICCITLFSCNGGKKTKNLVDFTPKLSQEMQAFQYILPNKTVSTDIWDDNINLQPSNLSISNFSGKFNTINIPTLQSPPIIVKNTLFFIDTKGIVRAYQLEPWKLLWSYDIDQSNKYKYFSGGIVYNENLLYITNGSRYLITVNANTGHEIWRKKFSDLLIIPPFIYDQKIVVQNISNELSIIDSNGNLIFQYGNIPATLFLKTSAKPIVTNNKLIISDSAGQFSAIEIDKKQLLWQINLIKAENDIPDLIPVNLIHTPIVDRDIIYAAVSNGLLMKLDVLDGNYYWKRQILDIQTMNKAGNLLFVTTNGKQVAAISTDTAKVVWTTDLESKNKKITQFLSPIIINDKLVIINNIGKLYILSPVTGKIIKTLSIKTNALSFAATKSRFYIFTKNSILQSK